MLFTVHTEKAETDPEVAEATIKLQEVVIVTIYFPQYRDELPP